MKTSLRFALFGLVCITIVGHRAPIGRAQGSGRPDGMPVFQADPARPALPNTGLWPTTPSNALTPAPLAPRP